MRWPKNRSSSLGRRAPCPASALSAAVTVSAARVFADGFVKQPPAEAVVTDTGTCPYWDSPAARSASPFVAPGHQTRSGPHAAKLQSGHD